MNVGERNLGRLFQLRLTTNERKPFPGSPRRILSCPTKTRRKKGKRRFAVTAGVLYGGRDRGDGQVEVNVAPRPEFARNAIALSSRWPILACNSARTNQRYRRVNIDLRRRKSCVKRKTKAGGGYDLAAGLRSAYWQLVMNPLDWTCGNLGKLRGLPD